MKENFHNENIHIVEKVVLVGVLIKGQDEAKQPRPGDLISQFKVENVTHNTVNIYNFNLTFTLEKLIEAKIGLLNL